MTRAVLILAVVIALGIALWRLSPAPRYQVVHAFDGVIVRLDSVTGDLAAFGLRPDDREEPTQRLRVWRLSD